MGRTRILRITLEELEHRIRVAELRKYKILKHLQKLKDSYALGEISYFDYTKKLNKKRNGQTIYEWIHYYHNYLEECEKKVQEQKTFVKGLNGFKKFLSGFGRKAVSKKGKQIVFEDILEKDISELLIEPVIVKKLKKRYVQKLCSEVAKDFVDLVEEIPSGESSPSQSEPSPASEVLIKIRANIRNRTPSNSKEVMTLLFALIPILLLIFASFYLDERVIFAPPDVEEHIESLNLEFSESTTHELQIRENGTLNSVMISGLIEGEGEARVYLDDLLILDTANIGIFFSPEEGVEESAPAPEPEPESESTPEPAPVEESEPSEVPTESYSETSEEVSQQEESSPSQEEPSPSETEEEVLEGIEPEENVTEIPEPSEVPTNVTEEIPEEPSEEPEPEVPKEKPDILFEINIREFIDQCEETCDLSGLGLDKSSYTLRIEITNAKLSIDELKYEIIPEKPIEKTLENITEVNITEFNITLANETISNLTNITTVTNLTNASIETIQYGAVINEPVKWKKKIKLETPGIVNITIPKSAENITVKKTKEAEDKEKKPKNKTEEVVEEKSYSEPIEETPEQGEESSPSQSEPSPASEVEGPEVQGETIEESESEPELKIVKEAKFEIEDILLSPPEPIILEKIWSFIKRMFGYEPILFSPDISEDEIGVIINDTGIEYEIEYETPAPIAIENETDFGKQINVSSEIHYENVLSYVWLLQEVEPANVRLYDENEQEVEVDRYDTNEDGLVDYIEWVIPNMSEHVYDMEVDTSKGKVKSYGPGWERLKDNDIKKGNILLYSGVKNVKEDGHWKNVEEARSLKDKEGISITVLEEDSDFPLEVVDFNLTSITLNLSIQQTSDVDNDVDLRVNNIKTGETERTEAININQTDKPEIVIVELNNSIGKGIEWGHNSSEIIINETTNVEDALIAGELAYNNYGDAPDINIGNGDTVGKIRRGLFRFKNIAKTIGEAGAIIENSEMYLYCSAEVNSQDRNISAFRIVKPWVEGTQNGGTASPGVTWYDWDNADLEWGCPGVCLADDSAKDNEGDLTDYDRKATAEDSVTITSCAGSWFNWDLTNATKNWYNGSWNENGVFMLSSGDGIPQSRKLFTSSEGTISYRPYLNITYTLETDNPQINFTSPTPPNDSIISDPSIEINVSIEEPNIDELIFNWNGTNFTIYNDSLIAMYNFDNVSVLGEDDTHIKDLSDHWNDGTTVGSPIINSSGRYGRSVSFESGNREYINITEVADDVNASQGTIIFWMKMNPEMINYPNNSAIIEVGYSGSTDFIGFRTDDAGNFYIRYRCGSNKQAVISDLMGFDTWHFIVGIWNSTDVSIYDNGVWKASATPNCIISQLDQATIGTDAQQIIGNIFFNGTIDEVRIWNRVLTAAEINQSYMTNLNKYDPYKWALYVNQTTSPNDNLNPGEYIYYASIKDNGGRSNETEVRIAKKPLNINTCNPAHGYDLIITETLTCNDTTMNPRNLIINSGGYLNLTNVTLIIVGNTLVKQGGNLTIYDSKNTIWQNGNLTIEGIYVLENSTLRMNGTFNGEIGINVSSTGEMIINVSSNITNGNGTTGAHYFFWVEAESSFTMEDSFLSECGWADIPRKYGLTINTTVNNFRNNILSDNHYGVVFYSDYNKITNITLIDNYQSGIVVTGNKNVEIEGISSYGDTILHIILEDSSNISLSDYYIKGNLDEEICIMTDDLSNSHIFDGNITSCAIGIAITGESSGNNISNVYINQSITGINIYNSSNNIIENSIIDQGLYLGIYLLENSYNNTIKGSILKGNPTGLYVDVGAFESPSDNKIYNNFFNNTNNFEIDSGISNPNYLNTTYSSEINIVNKTGFGGNFWAEPDGTGFSETCLDKDEPYGICDDYYNLSNGESVAVDWMPLSDKSYPTITLKSPPNGTYTYDRNITLDATIFDFNEDPIVAKIFGYKADEIDESEEDGLVLLMHFNNDSSVGENDTFVYDWSGEGNNGTCSGVSCPEFGDSYGRFRGAFELDGDGDYIEIKDSDDWFFNDSNFTISLWMYASDEPVLETRIIGQGDANYQYWASWLLRYQTIGEDTRALRFYGGNGTEGTEWFISLAANDSVSVREWHHIGIIREGSNAYLFIDGILKDTDSSADGLIYNINKPLILGAREQNGGGYDRFFNGSIDEIAIYNKSLSPQKIKELYDKGREKLIWQGEDLGNQDIIYNLTSFPLSVQDDMVLLMHFDNDSSVGENDTHVYDWVSGSYGYVNDSNASNDDGYNLPEWGNSGKFVGTFELDGIDDHIGGINKSVINESRGSVVLWARPRTFDNVTHIIWGGQSEGDGFSSPGGPHEFHIGTNHFNESLGQKGFTFFYGDKEDGVAGLIGGTNYTYLFSGNLTPDEWYHVVVTWDIGDKMTYMYINGTLADSDNISMDELPYSNSWQEEMYIGRPGSITRNRNFNGTVDELAVFDRALNPQEIWETYALTAGRYYWRGEVSDGESSSESDEWWFEINNSAPSVDPGIIGGPFYTNTTLRCEINATDKQDLYLIADVKWYINDENIWNDTGINCINGQSCYSNLSYNYTHHDDEIYCNVSAYDGQLWSEWADTSGVFLTIQNYTTNLTIWSEPDTPTQNQNVYFYANYTSLLHPVSGIGLGDYEISPLIWNFSTVDKAYSIRFADIDNNGDKEEVIVGENDHLQAIYKNGTEIWTSLTGDVGSDINEIAIGDLDNDGYFDEIVIADDGDYLSVFNETGSRIWTTGDLGEKVVSIAIGDLDNDDLEDDIVTTWQNSSDTLIGVWNTTDGLNWTNLWNITLGDQDNDAFEVIIGDFDRDGAKDDVATLVDTGLVYVFIGENGTSIWNTTDIGRMYAITEVDLDHDGFKDELIIGDVDNIYGFEFNGTYGVEYSENDAIFMNNSIANIHEISVADLDGDGWKDDIVVGDRGSSSGPGYIWTFNNDSNLLWNFSIPSNVPDDNEIFSLLVGDIWDDNKDYAIFSSENKEEAIWILDRGGNLIMQYTLGLGTIGAAPGKSPAIDLSDINNDGILDIAVASRDYQAHILQSVSCLASFNDSQNYSMTWNQTAKVWEFNRTFADPGEYEYNITCSKGGYETQVRGSVANVSVNLPPNITSINITPAIAYTNDTLTCVFNATDEYELDLTANVSWYVNGENVFNETMINCTSGEFCYSNLSYEFTHHDDLIYCNVSVADSYNWGDWVNSSSILILNYTTNLTIWRQPDTPTQNQDVYFYANYTSLLHPVSGIGLNDYEIGRVVWGINSTGNYENIEFFDYNGDGKRDELITRNGSAIKAFYNNGTEIFERGWPFQRINNEIGSIFVKDINNDGNDEIILSRNHDEINILLKNGTILWASGNLGGGIG
ncbi:MAG: LamG-like jellyroll fold domain-containing protein, partial [archaeon]